MITGMANTAAMLQAIPISPVTIRPANGNRCSMARMSHPTTPANSDQAKMEGNRLRAALRPRRKETPLPLRAAMISL